MALKDWRSAGTGINKDIDVMTTIWMIDRLQTNDWDPQGKGGGGGGGLSISVEATKPEQQSCLSEAPRMSAMLAPTSTANEQAWQNERSGLGLLLSRLN